MIGLITLSEDVLCKKEVLGRTFVCEIAEVKVKIHFPQYPMIDEEKPDFGISTPLLPPEIAVSWSGGEDPLFWGYPCQHPLGNSRVQLLALTIECEEKQIDICAQKLYTAIVEWEHSFLDYLQIKTQQGTERERNKYRNTCSLALLNDKKQVLDNRPIIIYGGVAANDSYATEESILEAIQFACSGKELLVEYQMLLSSYIAKKNNQNRRAILDACSAVEIVLVNRITDFCQARGLAPEIILDKYRSLGDRFRFIELVNIGLPKVDYQSMIVRKRNEIMHNKSIFPSDDATDKLIECVRKVLEFFHTSYY